MENENVIKQDSGLPSSSLICSTRHNQRKSIQEQIVDLSDIGESPETIAKEVSQPVAFVIDVINGDVPF